MSFSKRMRTGCLVGWNEEIIHRNGRRDQRLIGEIGDEGFERGTVGLNPVRPRVAVEQLVNFIDIAHEERRHVAQRAQIKHFLERDLFGFAKRVVEARGNEGISLVELFADGDEMHDRVDLRAFIERLFQLHVIGEEARDIRIAADRLGQARAQRRVDCAFLDQVAHRFVRGVLLDRHGLEQRQHGRTAVRAAGVHRPLNPMDLPEIDAVFVLQQPIDVDGRGHGEQRHAHALALEVLGRLDAGLAVNGDEAVAKRPRRKHRNGDERALLAGKALHEFRARKLGDIEFLAARHPVEDRSRLVDGDEIEVDAFGLDLAGVKRLHAVVEPARERKLQLGHLLLVPGALEQGLSLSTRARGAKTPIGYALTVLRLAQSALFFVRPRRRSEDFRARGREPLSSRDNSRVDGIRRRSASDWASSAARFAMSASSVRRVAAMSPGSTWRKATSLTSSASGTSLVLSARPLGVRYTWTSLRLVGLGRRTTYPNFSMALSAENVVGSMTPASSLSCRCVRPSVSHKMRKKLQWPYETECSVSRICSARARPRAACLTRCASRSLGTASCQCRSICRVTASPALRERLATIVPNLPSPTSNSTGQPEIASILRGLSMT